MGGLGPQSQRAGLRNRSDTGAFLEVGLELNLPRLSLTAEASGDPIVAISFITF